jgi:ParB-like chromosome segregation protein Spo0J
MSRLGYVRLEQIDVRDRIREDLGDIAGLMDSISELGLLQPLVVERLPDNPESPYVCALRCGGRRYQALTEMVAKKIVTDRFNYENPIAVTTFEELDEMTRLQVELEENFRRKSMSWQENVTGVARFHRMRVRSALLNKEDKWTQAMTAELFNVSQPEISNILVIDEYLRKKDERVTKAENAFAAFQAILGIELDAAQKLQLERERIKAVATAALAAPANSSNGQPAPGNTQLVSRPAASPEVSAGGATDVKRVLPLAPRPVPDKATILNWYHPGNALAVLPLLAKTHTINHIICDPPYGIDMANLTGASVERVAETHQVEDNLQLLRAFLGVAYNVLAEDGFLVMWYDLDHHEKIRDWAIDVGFRPQRWPLHWFKTSPCSNSQAQYNLTKSVEHCFFFRRSEKSVLATKRSSNAISGPNPRYPNHPFVKPGYVWEYLLDTVARPGQTIVDPFAGEGSSLAAMYANGYNPLGIEVDEKHIAGGLSYITEQLSASKDPLDDFIQPPM